MLEKLKTDFYSLITSLGLSVSDNRNFDEGGSPWLVLRTTGYQRLHSFNLKMSKITLVLDIFSQYNGEKEIIQITDTIADSIDGFLQDHPEVMFCHQKTLKILDDKATGPIRKHGVLAYEFLMGESAVIEEEDQDE